MTKIEKAYLLYLTDLVDNGKLKNYSRLMQKLYDTDFFWLIERDANRAADGLILRSQWIGDNYISDWPEDKDCSVLEMMVALAVRCEEDIMADEDVGDRTHVWFWEMLNSMDVLGETDDNYDDATVEEHISIMLNREYDEYGDGGLFYVENPMQDMRDVEIWYQLNWYLNELN